MNLTSPSLHQLERTVKALPDAVLTAMCFRVTGVREEEEFKLLVAKLKDYFARHITSPQHRLTFWPNDDGDHFLALLSLGDDELEVLSVPVDRG